MPKGRIIVLEGERIKSRKVRGRGGGSQGVFDVFSYYIISEKIIERKKKDRIL